jgi:hypothetical protein
VGIGNGTPKDYDVIAEMCRGNITFVNDLLQFCGTGRSGSCSIGGFHLKKLSMMS